MNIDMPKSKVYALADAQGRVTRIEGGYTMDNIKDIAAWVQVDEGYGDRFNLCQSNYLDKPLMYGRGVYRYKLVDGAVVERTALEMDADAALLDEQVQEKQSAEERIAALEEALRLLLEGATE